MHYLVLSSVLSITESIGEDAFNLKCYQSDGSRARVQIQQLDRLDGTYIIRFKMFQSYTDMKFEVMYDGKHVAGSPYTLKGWCMHAEPGA